MKAIQYTHIGGPEVAVYSDVPDPIPKVGEVRVKIQAAGLNFIDIYQRIGLYKIPLPYIPGLEGAGVVDLVGDGANSFRLGDRVAFTMHPGAYAEYVTLPEEKLVKLPESVSTELAAALMLQGLTAHYLCTSTYPLKAGDTCLVHAAAGGVGHLLVQIAKLCGARVLATVSTPEKEKLAREAGADVVVSYWDFAGAIKEYTGGEGVNVVYDSVGRDTFNESLEVLKPRGYMVLYGQASGPVSSFDPGLLAQKGSLFLTRPGLAAYIATPDELQARTNDLFRWVEQGAIKVRIDRKFAMSAAAEAHRYMGERCTKGKVLLIPDV